MSTTQFEDHLRELAEIADLAQREPREALMRVLVTEPQPGSGYAWLYQPDAG